MQWTLSTIYCQLIVFMGERERETDKGYGILCGIRQYILSHYGVLDNTIAEWNAMFSHGELHSHVSDVNVAQPDPAVQGQATNQLSCLLALVVLEK